jgi:hypothetical protein
MTALVSWVLNTTKCHQSRRAHSTNNQSQLHRLLPLSQSEPLLYRSSLIGVLQLPATHPNQPSNMSEQDEPPPGEVRVPLPKDFWLAHFQFVKALFQASMLTHYGYDGASKCICLGYYRYLELVEDGRWDWTENQVGHEDTDRYSMPPNDTLKYPCSPEVYAEYVPVLEALLEARAINAFSYDDNDGNICVDYYHWSELATWGPWDNIRDQMLAMEPGYAQESEAGRRYAASMQKYSGDKKTSGSGVDPSAATE